MIHKQNCFSKSSGVCFFTTTMELAHGDILLQMIPASNKFLISCFRMSWCLWAKGYGQAATGTASGLVALYISMTSVWPISLLLFEIMASYFCNSLYWVIFVSFEILALLRGTCLWICKLLGINTEVYELMASYFCNSLYWVIFVSFEILALLRGTCLWICKLLGINTEVYEIMASYFCTSLYWVIFVSFVILVLLRGTCLWICKLLGINTEGHESLHILHEVDG